MTAAAGSLRARVTLWYAGVLAAALLVVALVLLGLAEAGRVGETDRLLHRDFEIASLALVPAAGGGLVWREQQHFHDSDHDDPDPAMAVHDSSGQLVMTRGAPGLIEASAHNAPGYSTRAGVRLLSARLTVAGTAHWVVLARPLEWLSRDVRRLGVALALGVPLVLALAVAGGWWVAGRALAPLAGMAAHAARIEAQTLHERLPVGGAAELASLARTYNAAFDRLEQAFNHLHGFSGDVAHALRTPLAAIRATAERALAGTDAAATRTALEVVAGQSARMNDLAERLLLLHRAETGTLALERGTVDLAQIVQRATDLLGPLADRLLRPIIVSAPDNPPYARADAALVEQIILDLIDNAIRHGSGTIHVLTGAVGGTARIAVTDAGPATVTADRADTAGSGARLGLSISRGIARALDGSVSFETGPSGTSAVLTLPLAGR